MISFGNEKNSTHQKESWKKVGFWIRVAISFGACIVILSLINWSDFADKLRIADSRWLILAFAVIHIDRFWMAYKWCLLLNGSGVFISICETFKTYYIGAFWGTFIPFSVGADMVRISSLIRLMGKSSEIVSSVIIERLLGLLALGLVSTASLILAFTYLNLEFHAYYLVVLFLVVASMILIIFIFNTAAHGYFRNLISRLSQRLDRIVEKLSLAILVFKQKNRLIFVFLILSIVEQVFPIINIYLLAKAYAIDLPLVWAIVAVPLNLVVSRMPISWSGFGITEGFYVFVFSLAGLDATDSLLLALTDRILLLIAALPGAWWTITQNKWKSLRTMSMNHPDPAEGEPMVK
jgi:uncharacterized protein (TIRG00374 family)